MHGRGVLPAVGGLVILALTAGTTGLATAAAHADADADVGAPASVVVPAADSHLRFVGRWERHYRGDEAATVNSGGYLLARFDGVRADGLFDVEDITVPPQVWVTVDDGPRRLLTVDSAEQRLTPPDLGPGAHTLRLDVKDTDQVTNRWLVPLNDALVVRGLRLDPGARILPPPPAAHVRMAFFGDSITEGIRALGDPLTPDGADGTRAWANLTARSFGADFAQVGFGKQGIMRDGVGNVPWAPQSFGFNFAGSPADPSFQPDVVVLLQGSNDSQVTDAQFAPAYLDYLREVRSAYPDAWIIAMVPLIGRHLPVIESDVTQLGDPRVVAVDTTGWLDRHDPADYTDTVHPTVAGHLKVAQRLVPEIARVTGLPVVSSPVTADVRPVPVASQGEGVTVDVTVHRVLDPTAGTTRGTVDVTPPPGFTVQGARHPYVLDGDTATVPIRLVGSLPSGTDQSTGEVRVLVDGQVETLPLPLIVTREGS
jgi:lysophospholipase L1-like esterase